MEPQIFILDNWFIRIDTARHENALTCQGEHNIVLISSPGEDLFNVPGGFATCNFIWLKY
jgi:hypothetical protein